MLQTFFLIALFILGAAVGSFISVFIYRLHAGKKGIISGRSHCPDCEEKLAPLDLIPIVSFLVLRGKCRYCSKEISYMYPLLEIMTGTLFSLLFLKFPFFDATLNFSEVMLGMYALFAAYFFVLVFTFFYDLHYLQIADEILLPAIIIGLIATIATPLTPNIFDALLGAAIALLFFGAQFLFSKGTWIGLGDLRVGAFMGVILGWKMLLVALVLSYLLGSFVSLFIAAKKKKFLGIKIPFAPFLVGGTLVTIFFGDQVLAWYLQTLGF